MTSVKEIVTDKFCSSLGFLCQDITEIATKIANKLSVSLGYLCAKLTTNDTDSERMDFVHSVYKEAGQHSEALYDFCMKNGRNLPVGYPVDVLSGDEGNDVIKASGVDKQPVNEE